MDERAAAPRERELIAELAIEPRNARDGLKLMAMLGGPPVDDLELGAHEPTTAVVDMGTDELGLADPDGNAAKGPDLGHEKHGRDDRSAWPVLDHGGLIWGKGWMPAREEVPRPRGHRGIGLGRVLSPQHVGVESRQGFRVGRSAVSEDQPLSEIANHLAHPGA